MDAKSINEQLTALEEQYDFKPGHTDKIAQSKAAFLTGNPDYKKLSTTNMLNAAQAKGYPDIYGAYLAHKDGEVVSGKSLFGALRMSHVIQPGLSLEANFANVRGLADDLVGEEKDVKSFKDYLELVVKAIKPSMEPFLKQVTVEAKAALTAAEKVVSTGQVRKRK